MLRLLIIFKISQASLPYYLLSGLHNINSFQVRDEFWGKKVTRQLTAQITPYTGFLRFVFSLILAKDIQVWKRFQRGSLKIHVVFIEERTIQAPRKIGQEEKEKQSEKQAGT